MLGGTGAAGLPRRGPHDRYPRSPRSPSAGSSQRFGRRPGLALGYGTGGARRDRGRRRGRDRSPVAAVRRLALRLRRRDATNLQARYAGADLAAAHRRARAVSISWCRRPSVRSSARTSSRSWASSPRVSASRRSPDRSSWPPSRTLPPATALLLLLRPDPLLLAIRLPTRGGARGRPLLPSVRGPLRIRASCWGDRHDRRRSWSWSRHDDDPDRDADHRHDPARSGLVIGDPRRRDVPAVAGHRGARRPDRPHGSWPTRPGDVLAAGDRGRALGDSVAASLSRWCCSGSAGTSGSSPGRR